MSELTGTSGEIVAPRSLHDVIATVCAVPSLEVLHTGLPSTCRDPGHGLGLVRRVIDRHDGGIGVESKPGEGSTCRFTSPGRGDQR